MNIIRFLDRRLTGAVACRNCPQWSNHRQTREAGGNVYRLGTCARDEPVMSSYPAVIECLPIKYADSWCSYHPLHRAKQGENLYYAPEEFGKEHAGFNRPPSLLEALHLAQAGAKATKAQRARFSFTAPAPDIGSGDVEPMRFKIRPKQAGDDVDRDQLPDKPIRMLTVDEIKALPRGTRVIDDTVRNPTVQPGGYND